MRKTSAGRIIKAQTARHKSKRLPSSEVPDATRVEQEAPQHYRPQRLKGAARQEHGTEWCVMRGDEFVSPQPSRSAAFEEARQFNVHKDRFRRPDTREAALQESRELTGAQKE